MDVMDAMLHDLVLDAGGSGPAAAPWRRAPVTENATAERCSGVMACQELRPAPSTTATQALLVNGDLAAPGPPITGSAPMWDELDQGAVEIGGIDLQNRYTAG